MIKHFLIINTLNLKKDKKVGDTDTNAAIAGALLGAYYDILNMCKDVKIKEALRTIIHADTIEGGIVRSQRYYPNETNFEYLSVNALKLFLQSLR